MAIEETQLNQGLLDAAIEINARRRDTQVRLKEIIRARESWDEADRLITELVPDVYAAKTSRPSRVRYPRPAPQKGK